VIVRGAGPDFSAGLDRAEVDRDSPSSVFAQVVDRPEAAGEQLIAQFQAAFSWLSRPDIVSIAVVQGNAIGAGFQLALACDLRLLADNASLAMAEVRLGLVPDLGGTKRLVELVGYSRAAQLCLTGQAIGAAEAQAMGLAVAVTPLAELEAGVDTLVTALLAPPRDAVIETKALLVHASGRSQNEQEAAERAAQVRRLRDLAGIDRES
jgi:enoyl-CoA hydratase/carnithine racemase